MAYGTLNPGLVETSKTLDQACISGCLDCCNSLLYTTHLKVSLGRYSESRVQDAGGPSRD